MQYPLTLTKKIGSMSGNIEIQLEDANGQSILYSKFKYKALTKKGPMTFYQDKSQSSPVFTLDIQQSTRKGRVASVQLANGNVPGMVTAQTKSMMSVRIVLQDNNGMEIGVIDSDDSWKGGASIFFKVILGGLIGNLIGNKTMTPNYVAYLREQPVLNLHPDNKALAAREARRVIEKVASVDLNDEALILAGVGMLAAYLT